MNQTLDLKAWGIPVTPRLAETLGIAKKEEQRKQMSHGKSPALDEEKTKQWINEAVSTHLPDFLKGSVAGFGGIPVDIVDMALAPAGLSTGKPVMGSKWIGEKLGADTENLPFQAGQFFEPGGLLKGGMAAAGIIGKATPDILQGITDPKITSKIERMEQFVKDNPDRWSDSMVRDPATGRNYFYGPDKELMIEYQDVMAKPRINQFRYGIENTEDFVGGLTTYSSDMHHPDPQAAELLKGINYHASSIGGDNYFSSGTWHGDQVEVSTLPKKRLTADPNIPAQEYLEQSKAVHLLNMKRGVLAEKFVISLSAHEGSHALQKVTGAPQGGNPAKEGRKIFEETIGRDPVKLEQYNRANDIATNWLAQDPMSLMVAMTRISKDKATYNKYVDMLYSTGEDLSTNKFFKRIEVKDTEGKVTGIDFKPDKDKILTEITRDAAAGKIDLTGTALEPWHQMNVDAFQAYRHKHGEAYARVAQSRAFKAMKADDPNEIYRQNPNEFLDVDPNKVTYPVKFKPYEDLALLPEEVLKTRRTFEGAAGGKTYKFDKYFDENGYDLTSDEYMGDAWSEFVDTGEDLPSITLRRINENLAKRMEGKEQTGVAKSESFGNFFTPEVVQQVGEAPGFKSRSKIIEMPIDDFLAMAYPLDKAAPEKVDNLEKILSSEKLKEPLYLQFDHKGATAKVQGHEGRHRALALKKRGVETVPVELRSSRIRWSEQDSPDKFDYLEDWPEELIGEDGKKTITFPVKR